MTRWKIIVTSATAVHVLHRNNRIWDRGTSEKKRLNGILLKLKLLGHIKWNTTCGHPLQATPPNWKTKETTHKMSHFKKHFHTTRTVMGVMTTKLKEKHATWSPQRGPLLCSVVAAFRFGLPGAERAGVCGCWDVRRRGSFLLHPPSAEGRAVRWPSLGTCGWPWSTTADSKKWKSKSPIIYKTRE